YAVPAPSRRELWGLYLATLVCCFWESAYCNPSVTPPACQLPLAREPLVQSSGFSLLRTQYHLVVEVQAVNLQLAGSSRRCTAAVDFVPGMPYKEALILAVMSRML